MTTANKGTPAATAVLPPRRSRAANLNAIRKIWPWFFLILMVAVFTVWAKAANDTNFLSPRAIQSILVYATQILLIGLGETLVMIAAGIDLSAGYTLGLSAVVAAEIMKMMYAHQVNPALTLLVGLFGGMLICILPGLINGWLVAWIRVPPFISTLGMGYAIFGAAQFICDGTPVASQPPYLGQLGNGYLLYYWPAHGINFFKMPVAATSPDYKSVVPLLPNVVLITLVVTMICWFILSKTQFGQHLYAIGGNPEAAVRAGIPVKRTLLLVYALAAILAGIAGSLWASRFTSGAADPGVPTLLFSIAAVVIGGASMFGGEGTIVGTVIGSLIIATIQFGLVVLGQPSFAQFVTVGIVVVVAVIVDQLGRKMDK